MALFQLDPQSIAARVRVAGESVRIPTLAESIVRGAIGFTVVSVAGFAPWPIFEKWFRHTNEIELYLACLAAFIGLSGLCLHRLIIGPGSMPRFYKLFALAFTAYAAAWVVLWMALRDDEGSFGGVLAGAVAMGAVLAWAFDAWREFWKVVAALFVLNFLGYCVGGRVAGKLAIEHRELGMLLWGAAFGLGFGAGLGMAFYWCQGRAREVIGKNTETSLS